MLICLIVIVLSTTMIGLLSKITSVQSAQIAIGMSLGALSLLAVAVVILITTLWLYRKERRFYADNFPFDFTDVSNIPMRKKFKEQLQEELNAERALHPHRYGEGGNGSTVEFSDMGLKLYDFDLMYGSLDTTDEIFGVPDTELDAKCLVCTIDYQTLNFVALPFYSKKLRPLSVVIKSRLDKSPDGANLENDVHLILDSNLLTSLQQFNVPVENLQYILDNKEQLIADNCGRIAKQ